MAINSVAGGRVYVYHSCMLYKILGIPREFLGHK